MPAFTTHLNLYLPGGGSLGIGGDDEEADIDKINQNMQALDAWSATSDTRFTGLEGFQATQTSRNQQFTGLAANIGSVVGMKLGDTYQETDGAKRLWEYDGSNWITSEGGLYLIRPTSVTGTNVTLNDAGHVALAATTGNVGLLGIFSSRFDHYLIDIEFDNSAGDNGALFQLKSGGVDVTTGYYGTYTEQALGVGPSKLELSNAANFSAGRYATNGGAMMIEVFRPSKTVGTKNFMVRSQDSATYARSGGGYLASAAAMDGFNLILGAVSVTAGKIRVYGYR